MTAQSNIIADYAEFEGHTEGPWKYRDGAVFAPVQRCCMKPIQHPNFDAGGNPTTIAYEECCGNPEIELTHIAECGINDSPLIAAAPSLLSDHKRMSAEIEKLREVLEDVVETLEAMDLHIDNPLYDRTRAILEASSSAYGSPIKEQSK